MKNINYIKTVLFAVVFTFLGCQEDEYSFGDIVTPSNIVITAEIVGADAANPNGDGSGVVNFTATADNAVSYKYVFNGEETVSLSGNNSISFSSLGLNTYTVTVVASGTAGVTSSKSIEVEVLSTYAPPADLIAKLYGFDPADPTAVTSRTWSKKQTFWFRSCRRTSINGMVWCWSR
jgi:PKD repeat protein